MIKLGQRKLKRMNSKLVKYAAEFFKISEEEAIARVEQSTQALADEWKTKESIEDYYKSTTNYIFDLIMYNTDDRVNTTIYPISKYSRAKILDFGGGIGEISRRLSFNNKMFYYDIPSKTQEFAKFVTEREGNNVTFLTEEELYKHKFNIIIAVDVFEHLEDPIGCVKKLINMTDKNNFILTTGLDFNMDEKHPQHLRENVLKRPEFIKQFQEKFFLVFYHVSGFGVLYLWRKKT